MPRFLSRAGTNIDDLERQLARVGSAENDASSDEAISSASVFRVPVTERTPLLSGGSTPRILSSPQQPSSFSARGSIAQSAEHTSLAVEQQSALRHSDEIHFLASNDHGGEADAAYLATASQQPHHHQQQQPRQQQGPGAPPRKLGTWDGVFMPVTLTIWGILVYVRMGYFISQVGIVGTIGSFMCGYAVTTLTTLSISAISTNGTVKGGGPYYMLSRSLGPEFGGSIGLMFYTGTLLAGALNAVAFVEPMMSNFGQIAGDVAQVFPEGPWWYILYSSVLLALCTTVCLTGAQMFAKASTFLSTIIVASIAMILASFALKAPFESEVRGVYYSGWSIATFRENLWPELTPLAPGQPSETYSSVLGVLFPACIGIMAGASMSSQLRKPSKSIAKGTLWAVGVTFVLYMTLVVSLGATTRRHTLRTNFNVLQEINVLPIIVPIGSLTTGVTSTLSGLLSAASVLQAIAKDDLFAVLTPLKRLGRNDTPTRAIVTTYAISQIAFFVGDTNAVAPFTTMFNLIMFAFVNLACLVLKLAASVNFRPTFQYFKAWTAAVGAIGCFSVMLFVDALSALASTAVVVVLFLYVHYTCPPKPWGDVTQSLIYHQCRKFMLRLDLRKDHVKFWRPQILLLVHNPRSSLHLVRFCNALKKGGLYVIGHVIKGGDFRDMMWEFRRQETAWLRLIDVLGVKAFLNMAIDKSDDAGARSIVFGAGLGGMRPNIVVMGFINLDTNRADPEALETNCLAGGALAALPTDGIQLNTPISPVAYLRIIEDVLTMGKALGIAYGFSKLGSVMPALPTGDLTHRHTLFTSQSSASIPNHLGLKTSRSNSTSQQSRRQYIDLWPIQIGTATTAVSADGKHAYLTNFDSYVMVLQLGTVLHLVPYWNKHYRLRVMCFVEDQRDVDEEYRRVAKLLRDLRVKAELHVHYMRGAGLATYDQAASSPPSSQTDPQESSMSQEPVMSPKTPPMPLPPNSRQRQGASTNNQPQVADELSLTPSGFSMRVNLPMPLRYEATRLEHVSGSGSLTAEGSGGIVGTTATATTTGSSSSHEISSDSDSDSDMDEHDAPLLANRLPLSAQGGGFGPHRIAFGSRNDAALLPGGSAAGPISRRSGRRNTSFGTDGITGLWNSLQRINTTGSTSTQQQQDDSGSSSGVIRQRRCSDGSMVLSNLYPHALAAATAVPLLQVQPPSGMAAPESTDVPDAMNQYTGIGSAHHLNPTAASAGGALGLNINKAAAHSGSSVSSATEFNDMPIGTQNLILNELIRRESKEGSTAVIFTTLQAPEPGTSDSEKKTMEYLRDIDTLAKDLPPVFLVHATSLTVTTSL
ncbi:hypothetical protein IW140_000603 [Coemansia sp. RSA 1813]|nr:hypothetical protein LPJ74_000171 [Coemansia sp. RSA 1843]KAJ2092537.1 hypothetical protein IW138_000975 [Coemansia sp. RSA 986]KAJ2216768.1 hypothetical protein EV179_001058 [Coemansia sp. RSA 487]KAJ2572840.1 hypothetical protein IW140_000603 [Coemansia sp. RSA 1813]